MEGIAIVGGVVLLAVLPASLLMLSWIARPRAMRELAKGEIKTRPIRYSTEQLEARRRGCYAEFGLDYHTRQPFILPEELRRTNFLNIGPSNSGKTFYMLNSLIWRDVFFRDNAVVVFDSQGDLIEPVIGLCREIGREYVVFPDAGYNPLGGEGSARDRAESFADLIAQSAETAIDAESRFYVAQEQDFIRVMLPLYEAAYHQPMTLQELVYLCKRADYRTRLKKDAGVCPESDAYDLYVATLSPSQLTKVLAGLVSTIQKLTVGERIVHHNVRASTTLEMCLRQRKVILIREGGTKTSRHRPLGLMYMIRLQNAILSRNAARPGPFVSVYMDEAYRYFNTEFEEFVNTNRKYNCALHLGFQTIEQLEPHVNAILGGCGTWAVHGRLLADDAKIIADNIGQRLFALKSISQSASQGRGGLSQTETTGYDYLFPPHFIRNLPQQYLLLLSLEGRETQPVRTILKPTARAIATTPYHPPQVGAYPPRTIWDERDAAAAAGGGGGNASGQGKTRPSTPAGPTRQVPHTQPPSRAKQPGPAPSPQGSKHPPKKAPSTGVPQQGADGQQQQKKGKTTGTSSATHSTPPDPSHRGGSHDRMDRVRHPGSSAPAAPSAPAATPGPAPATDAGRADGVPPAPRRRAPHFDASEPTEPGASRPDESGKGTQNGADSGRKEAE